MKALAIKDIVKAVHALDYPSEQKDETIDSVAFDSRNMKAGGLFVPLQGERDGHDYVEDARDKGAKASFWSRPMDQAPQGIILIQVKDCLQALQALAAYYRNLINPKVVGITGSDGKTTTKDLTAAALSSTFRVYKTQGNYNNEIGVPMTILDMPENTEVLVLEMGMSAKGEISLLSRMARPDVAVITMIGESHIEYLGSRENICAAKMEILDGLKAGGSFIYPGDEPLIEDRLPEDADFSVLRVGLDDSEDVFAVKIDTHQFRTSFYTNLSPECKMEIPLTGDYNVKNALMACAVSYTFGLSVEQIRDSMSKVQLSENRNQWLKGIKDTQIFNDTYNASPAAMKVVIDNFGKLDFEDGGRRVLVLGDMLELGDQAPEMHRSLHEHIRAETFALVFMYGFQMRALFEALLADGFPQERLYYTAGDMTWLIDSIKEAIQPKDKILVKGSHSMGLLQVVEALSADA